MKSRTGEGITIGSTTGSRYPCPPPTRTSYTAERTSSDGISDHEAGCETAVSQDTRLSDGVPVVSPEMVTKPKVYTKSNASILLVAGADNDPALIPLGSWLLLIRVVAEVLGSKMKVVVAARAVYTHVT